MPEGAVPLVVWSRAVVRLAASFAPVLPVVLLLLLMGLPGGAAAGGADGSGGTLADAVSGLVVLGCAVRAVRGARRPLTRVAAVVLGLPVVGVALAAVGSVGTSGVTGMVRYLQVFVLVPAAVVLLVRNERDLRLLAWSFVTLALWQGGVGVRQYLTGTGASYQGADVRAVGTFGPNDIMGMATVVSFGLVCAVGLALGSGARAAGTDTRGRRHGYGHVDGHAGGWGQRLAHGPGAPYGVQRVAAALCALLLVAPLALSFSRGAWIATVVALSAQLVMAGLRHAVRVFAAVAAAAVVLVAGMGVGSQMLSERLGSISQVADAPDQSVTDRYTMWAAAVDMWRAEPLAGVGLKQFPEERDSHASLALSSGSDVAGAGTDFHRQPLLSPHNMYLLVLSEQGLIGLSTLAGSWAALLVLGLRRAATGPRGTGSGAGSGSGSGGSTGSGAGGSTSGGASTAVAPAKDCAAVACGLLVWQLTDFVYADIGGPSTVLTAVVLGMAAWWALGDRSPAGVTR